MFFSWQQDISICFIGFKIVHCLLKKMSITFYRRIRIDGGLVGFNPPVPLFIPLWLPNPSVPAVLLTLPVHFPQFEPCSTVISRLKLNLICTLTTWRMAENGGTEMKNDRVW